MNENDDDNDDDDDDDDTVSWPKPCLQFNNIYGRYKRVQTGREFTVHGQGEVVQTLFSGSSEEMGLRWHFSS